MQEGLLRARVPLHNAESVPCFFYSISRPFSFFLSFSWVRRMNGHRYLTFRYYSTLRWMSMRNARGCLLCIWMNNEVSVLAVFQARPYLYAACISMIVLLPSPDHSSRHVVHFCSFERKNHENRQCLLRAAGRWSPKRYFLMSEITYAVNA